jgi:hypothetical protein
MSKVCTSDKIRYFLNIFRHDATDRRDTGVLSTLLPVREMSGSNLGLETGYVCRNSTRFSQSVQANTRVVIP